MKFKEPSPEDRFFATPAATRPDINLSLSGVPQQELPPNAVSIDASVTRWFNLVYGFALDSFARRGRDPHEVNRALAAGDLLARAFFFQLDRQDGASSRRDAKDFAEDEAAFVGTIDAEEDLLYVSGGPRGALPNSVMYRRRGDAYVPFLSQVALESGLEARSVPIPEPLTYDPNRLYTPPAIPDELRAAHSLGVLADVATFHLGARTIAQRGRVYMF